MSAVGISVELQDGCIPILIVGGVILRLWLTVLSDWLWRPLPCSSCYTCSCIALVPGSTCHNQPGVDLVAQSSLLTFPVVGLCVVPCVLGRSRLVDPLNANRCASSARQGACSMHACESATRQVVEGLSFASCKASALCRAATDFC